MRKWLPAVLTGTMLLPVAAMAHHKDGHSLTSPGEPSDRFTLFQINAGATCTAPIEEPDGTDALSHGGPAKRGFAPHSDIELVEVSPDVVQFCFVDGEPRSRDLQVRVSFVPEEEEVAQE